MEPPVTTQSGFIDRLSGLYEEPLLTYLTQILGNSELAREVAQGAFAKLNTTYRPDQVQFPRALLFKVATTLALVHLRHPRLQDTLCLKPDEMKEDAIGPHRQAMADQIEQHLVTVIKALHPNLRTVFVMAHVQGKSRSEIAAVLSISEKRLDKRLTAALKQCRERLAARGVDLAEFD